MDLHCWIEFESGTFDPTGLDALQCMMVTTMRGVDATKGTMVYEEYTGDQLRAAIREWLTLRPVYMGRSAKELEVVYQRCREDGYSRPNQCFINTEVWLHDHPESGGKRKFGRAGWRRSDGTVWWEWG
jgi:hypothetical protein